MAIRSGLASQLGWKEESTYGTYVAPDKFAQHVGFAVKLNQEEIQSSAIRAGQLNLRGDQRANNRLGVEGELEFEVRTKGMGLWHKHGWGASAITTPGGATNTRRHTYSIADLFPGSLTVQGGIPDVGGTVRPFSWLGCKVTSWSLSQALGEPLKLTVGVDGMDETTAQALAAASYPASDKFFDYGQCVVNVGGAAFHATSFAFTLAKQLKTDRRFLRGSTLKKEPVANGLRALEGTLVGEFEDLTAYNRFVSKTTAQIDVTWTGANIESSFDHKLTLTLPVCLFTGETPEVGGPDVVEQTLPFMLLDEDATLVWDTTDTAD